MIGHYFDISDFHADCKDKQVVDSGGVLYVYCPVCGVVADVSAIATQIECSDAFVIGDGRTTKRPQKANTQRSQGHPKGPKGG